VPNLDFTNLQFTVLSRRRLSFWIKLRST